MENTVKAEPTSVIKKSEYSVSKAGFLVTEESSLYERNKALYPKKENAPALLTTPVTLTVKPETATPTYIAPINKWQNQYTKTHTLYEKPPTDAETEEMLMSVAPSIYSYHKNIDDGVSESDKPQQLFMAYNGLGIRRTETFNGNTITITTKATTAPGLRSVKEGIEINIANKIPMNILKELIANFRAIYQRDTTESAAQVYRKKDGEYFVYYPVQENTGAHTKYDMDIKAALELRQEHTLVLEAHSHAGFNAFFSGGDDNNEKQALMYCVLGNNNSTKPSFVGRFKLMDKQQLLKPEEIFDIPEGVDALTFDDLPEPSEEMLANAKPASYSYNRIKTSAEIEEENIKKDIHTSGGGRTVPFQNANYGSYYNHGFHAADPWSANGYNDFNDDDQINAYIAERNNARRKNSAFENSHVGKRHRGQAKHNKNGNLPKFDIGWVVENLSDTDALTMFEVLIKRIEGGSK